jgi:hypothetical protein
MTMEQVNRVAGRVLAVLSFTALLAVLIGYGQPPHPDEGTGAHMFQLSVVAWVPMLLLFIATANWRQPWRGLRPLALPAAVLVFAFVALYHLEHR